MQARLPVRVKLAYGSGDLSMSIAYTIIGMFFLFYLTDTVLLAPHLAGAALLAARLWDAVSDPLMGYVSDATRSRWGRRRPYLLWGAVPLGLTFAALWLVPAGMGQWTTFTLVTALYVLHMTAITVVMVPYTALSAELTQDYDERTRLTAYRMAYSILGGLAAAAIPLEIVRGFTAPAQGYAVMGLVFGLAIMVWPVVAGLGCREPASGPRVASAPLLRGARDVLASRSVRLALAIYVLTWVGMDFIMVTFVYYVTYYLQLAELAPVLFLIIFGLAALCLPFWIAVSDRLGKAGAFAAGMVPLAGVLIAAVWLPPRSVAWALGLAVLSGAGVSCAHVIPWSIMPDCVEEDELKHGVRREGLFFGYLTFSQKLASAVAVSLVGGALKLAGYQPGVEQAPVALFTIRALLGLAPAAAFLSATALARRFPIDRVTHAAIREALESKRLAAAGGQQ